MVKVGAKVGTVAPRSEAERSERNRTRILRTRIALSYKGTWLGRTLIGTANMPVFEILPDETGYRRFFVTKIKNGDVLRGGDSRIREIVKNPDLALVWRCVIPFVSSPIKAVVPKHDGCGSYATYGAQASLTYQFQH